MEKHIYRTNSIIDWMNIIIQISYQLSLVPEFLNYLFSIRAGLLVPLLSIIFHLIRFGFHIKIFSVLRKYFIFIILFFIYILDLIQLLTYADSVRFFSKIWYIIGVFFFVSYLYNMYIEKKIDVTIENIIVGNHINDAIPTSYKGIIKPYLYFSIYNVIAICILAIILKLGGNYRMNALPSNLGLLQGHLNWDMVHYFPYYLSVAFDYHPLINIMGFPTMTGLAHEPHIIMFLISPAFMLLLSTKMNSKIAAVLIVLYAFVVMEAVSVTAILSLTFCIFLEFLWKFYNRGFTSTLMIFVFGLIVFIAFIALDSYVVDQLLFQINYKIGGSDVSGETSANMLSYILSPSDVLGLGNSPQIVGKISSKYNIGLLTSILDISLYILLMVSSLKMYCSKWEQSHYIGIAMIYLLTHGLKIFVYIFSYPYFIYMIFILSIIKNNKNYNFRISMKQTRITQIKRIMADAHTSYYYRIKRKNGAACL